MSSTPAFASANSGTITRLDQPCSWCSSHSSCDTDWRAMRRGLPGRLRGEHVEQLVGPRAHDLAGQRGLGGRQQPHDHAGDRRVDPRLVDREPEAHAQRREQRCGGEPEPAQDARPPPRSPAAAASHADLDRRRVEDGDHEDRADVVDDRERQQEQPDRGRDRRRDQRQDAQRERDVGRHRDAPPVGLRDATG